MKINGARERSRAPFCVQRGATKQKFLRVSGRKFLSRLIL
nr:MAG TPA: hypothetical protein [Caudoviricetes sp.]